MTPRTEPRVAPGAEIERSAIVGRATELAAIERAFADGARLVTLLGAAGIGKTRVARRHATLRLAGAGEVWYCDLAEGGGEAASLVHVADVLGVRVGPGAGADKVARAVAAALAKKDGALLVLDHAERALAAATRLVGEIRGGDANTAVLVASREALGVAGEVRVDLPPLGAADASALFTSRAAALGASAFSDEDKVRAVVDRLEGVPLAIELAAAFTPVVDLATLDRMLSEGLGFLDQGARGGSLGGALETSWALLGEDERRALARASVFRGGFDAAAARAVLGAHSLATIRALREKSLLRTNRVIDELGLGMFASVRAFAAEKLDSVDDREDAARAHARYYAELGAAGDATKVRAELDNLVAAHTFLVGDDPIASVDALRGLALTAFRRGPIETYARAADATVRAIESRKPTIRRRRGGSARRSRRAATRIVSRATSTRRERTTIAPSSAPEPRATRRSRPGSTWRAGSSAGSRATTPRPTLTVLPQSISRSPPATPPRRGAPAASSGWRRRPGASSNRRAVTSSAPSPSRAAAAIPRSRSSRPPTSPSSSTSSACSSAPAISTSRRSAWRARSATSGSRARSSAPSARSRSSAAISRSRARASRRPSGWCAIGVRRHEAMTNARLGVVALAKGDAETARGLFARADDLALGGLERRHGLYRAGAAAALALLGDPAEAEKLLASARSILGPVGDPGYVAAAWVFEGFVLLARGDEAAARARFDDEDPHARDVLRSSDARAARVALEAALEGAPPAPPARTTTRPIAGFGLVVGADGRWFEATGPGRVDLSRRKALRLLLRALADQRVQAPGAALGLRELFAAGWPGERASALAAARRVYTAVGMLRDMGLRNTLVRRDDGYLLDPVIAFDMREAP